MFLLIPAAFAVPIPLSPEDGAQVGATVTFSVQTEQTTTIFVRQAIGDADPFRIVALPDTQFYTTEDNLNENGDLFAVQTEWIADNAEDVAFVTHLGDIVQDWDDTVQWAQADAAMSMLDDVVPYGLVVGNHDYPAQYPEKEGKGLFDDYFPTSRFEKQPWWGGSYPKGTNDNNYQVFSSGALKFLILHLKFEPDAPTRQWASEVIEDYSDHRVIISTHSHLGSDGELWVMPSYDPSKTLWTDLVEPYDNVFLVLSAHVDGEAYRTDYVGDRAVHQILACYQSLQYGGGSRLRLLDFSPEENRIDISTYSPWTDTWEEDEDSMFSLDYQMGNFSEIGSGAPKDGVVTLTWEVSEGSDYEWIAETEDGQRSEIRTFSVDGIAPEISDVVASGLASKGIALISWVTDESADGVVFINGVEQASTRKTGTEHAIELTGLPAAFALRITAADAVGNTSSTEELWIELALGKDPEDSGGSQWGDDTDSTPDTDTSDTGQSPEDPGCGEGCAAAAPGGGFLLLMLLVPFRRARTRASSSVR